MQKKIIHDVSFSRNHPVFDLVEASIAELRTREQTNFNSARDLFSYIPQVVWAKDQETHNAVGALVFCSSKADYIFLLLACVSPEHRRRGAFKAMWSELQVIAEQSKVRGVDLGVAMSNEVMHSVMGSVGAIPRWLYYRLEVPPTSSVQLPSASNSSSEQ